MQIGMGDIFFWIYIGGIPLLGEATTKLLISF